MLVLHKNKFYVLDMSYDLFNNRRQQNPNEDVLLSDPTTTHTERVRVRLGEINDYSIERNLIALKK